MAKDSQLPKEIIAYQRAMGKPTYTSKGHSITCPVGAGTVEPFYVPQISGMGCAALGLHYTISIDKSGTTATTITACTLENLLEDLFIRNAVNEKIITMRDGRATVESLIVWNHHYINDGIYFHLDTNTTCTFNVDALIPLCIPPGRDPYLVEIEQANILDDIVGGDNEAVNSITLLPSFHYTKQPVYEYGADTFSITLNANALTSFNPYLNTKPAFFALMSGFDDEVADRYWPYFEDTGVIDDVDILDGKGFGMRLDGHELYYKWGDAVIDQNETIWESTHGTFTTLKYLGLNLLCVGMFWDPNIMLGRTMRFDVESQSGTNQSLNVQLFFGVPSASIEVDTNAPEVQTSPVPEPSTLQQVPTRPSQTGRTASSKKRLRLF